MPEIKITKQYSRKLSLDYDSWGFMTEVTRVVKVNSKEEFIKKSDEVFRMAKYLTDRDIENTKSEMVNKKCNIIGNN